MSSIKKNFFYNSVLSISNYLFPFLTFPYISRILGVDYMGKCNFADSIINYFLLFSMLGIGTVGIREIAKCKTDDKKLSEIFSSLLTINIITTIIISVIYISSIFYVTKFSSYKELLFIGLAKIISSLFMIDWFYAGIENFRYITIRSIIIKSLYVVSIFFLIKTPEDYVRYFFLTVLMVVINAIFNLFYSRKLVKFTINNINLRRFIKPIIIMGIYSILTYMYTSFNVIYLGFMGGDKEVGYYTTATKIYTILLSLFTAFTTVMLPRMSQLVADKKIDEVNELIGKSYDALFLLCFPVLIVGYILAPQIIAVIAGKGYEGAIIPMQIVMPLILIIGIAQILIIQILMPFNRDRNIFVNSLIGAAVGILFNVLLVGRLHSIGSAIVLILSELAVVISANYFVSIKMNIHIPFRKLAIDFLYAIPYGIVSYLSLLIFKQDILILFSTILFSMIYFTIMQKYFIKNPLISGLESNMRNFFS